MENLSPEEVLEQLPLLSRSAGIAKMIVTMGAKGAVYYSEDGEAGICPAHKVDVVDTTGAGDTFCGGLAVAIAEGNTLREAAAFATAASALTVQKMGAQASIPYREDL